MARKKKTAVTYASRAEECAHKIRLMAFSQFSPCPLIPTTWPEYFAAPFQRVSMLNAFDAIRYVEYEARCSPEEAEETTERVMPELFAAYWLALPLPEILPIRSEQETAS